MQDTTENPFQKYEGNSSNEQGQNLRSETKLSIRRNLQAQKVDSERLEKYSQSSDPNIIYQHSHALRFDMICPTEQFMNFENEYESNQQPKDKVDYLTRLLFSNDLVSVQYSLKKLERIIYYMDKKIFKDYVSLFNQELVLKVMSFITVTNSDKKMMFEAIKIMINLTYYNNQYAIPIIDNYALIFQLTKEETDLVIQNELLWLLCQTIEANEKNYPKLRNACPDLEVFIFGYIEKMKQPSLRDIIDAIPSVLWMYSLIISNSQDRYGLLINKGRSDIPLLAMFLRSQVNPYIFMRAVGVIKEYVAILTDMKFDDRSNEYEGTMNEIERMLHDQNIISLLLYYFETWGEIDKVRLYVECRDNIVSTLDLMTPFTETCAYLLRHNIEDAIETSIDEYVSRDYVEPKFVRLFSLFMDLLKNCNTAFLGRLAIQSQIMEKLFELIENKKLTGPKSREMVIEIIDSLIPIADHSGGMAELLILPVMDYQLECLKDYDRLKEESRVPLMDSIVKMVEIGQAEIKTEEDDNGILEIYELLGIREILHSILTRPHVSSESIEKINYLLGEYIG
ncbi:MAG: hypothetical protein MJ252_07465 [archaeon]|nr:hypothetical protein [archaeon]